MSSGVIPITMWDFSWLERRWPGAGYERWEQALDELAERGYRAVRIDAYPHLIARDRDGTFLLDPVWTVQDWGAPGPTRVQPFPALVEFMQLCRERDLAVALSTWFRQDREESWNTVSSGRAHGEIWVAVLREVERAGLLDSLLYVDLCNEFPHKLWTPFLPEDVGHDVLLPKSNRAAYRWMDDALAVVREAYPNIDYTFSTLLSPSWHDRDLSRFDLLEHHLWTTPGEFYKTVGYNYERFDSSGYHNVALHAEQLYRDREARWHEILKERIATAAAESRAIDRPLSTTEAWAIVDYKDGPMLDWGWVKELCELGVTEALATGRWSSMCTSNFCGPQFRGMWRDVEWHQRLTTMMEKTQSATRS
jgi:hypothetical protein